MIRNFSLDSYKKLLLEINELGYKNVFFSEVNPLESHFVLRHDVDQSIESALKIAKLEKEINMKSIFFILLRTKMYNLFSFSNSQKVKEILSLGHEVGLHFDASLYSTDDLNHLDDFCRSECEILEKWFKFKINFISFHRPIKKFQGLKRKINGKSHSYEPRFFNEMIYCSDSKGDWHHGYPLEKLKEHPKRAIQLLTHPIWWDSEKNIDPVNKLDEFVIKHINEFCEEVKNNCVTFKKSKLIDKFKKLPYQ